MRHIIRSYSPEIIRLTLGLILAAASVSKISVFHSFAVSVSLLSGLPQGVSSSAAAILLVLELGTGLMLLLRRFVRAAAASAAILFVLFASVLSAAIVRQVDTPCNCFGAFGPDLPARGQAALDVVLAFLASVLTRGTSPAGREIHPSLRIIVPLSALLWGIAVMIWPRQASGGAAGVPAGNIPPGIETGISAGRPAVLLLADFDDFGCQLCLDDFLAFCDSLNGGRFSSAVSVRLVARRDSTRTAYAQTRMIEGWASGNSYRFPVAIDSGALFDRSGVRKTTAIVTAPDGRLIDVVHFPSGLQRRIEVLREIAG